MARDEVVAEKGVESVQNYVDGHAKANCPLVAAITAEGERLPLILIAKGKTNRYHKQFGRYNAHRINIWHLPSGCSTDILMLQYLDWLRE
jgi:hypothetical protein